MSYFPTLSPEARKVLDIILGESRIDGARLMKRVASLPMTPPQLIETLQELQSHRVIEIGGPLVVDELPYAQIAVLPSAKPYLQSMLKK